MWKTNPAYGNILIFENIFDDFFDFIKIEQQFPARGPTNKKYNYVHDFHVFIRNHKRGNNISATGVFFGLKNRCTQIIIVKETIMFL